LLRFIITQTICTFLQQFTSVQNYARQSKTTGNSRNFGEKVEKIGQRPKKAG